MGDTMVTSGQVAKELGVSVSLLRKLEALEVTPPARRLSRFRVYSIEEIEVLRQILEQRRAGQQSRSRQEARAA